MNNTNHTYDSRDFYLSGFLLASNEKLIDYWRTNGITTFIFEQTDRLNELIRKYYSMDAVINPIIYGQSLKNLKSIIYSNENTNELNSKNGRDR